MIKSFFFSKKWRLWAWGGFVFIIASLLAQTWIDVKINEWYKGFYDLLQQATERDVSEFYDGIYLFLKLAIPYVVIYTITNYFTRLYAFRWREAMTFAYMPYWKKVDTKVEGASQRIQEDTMRFASIMKSLGVSIVDSVMTLIAFLPVLLELSKNVKEIPIVGEIAYPLFYAAIFWSIFGTILMIVAGIKLPGLEFRNQRVEAAFRKELVLGEDDEKRAEPETLKELFANVRRNYFRIYIHYTYFNLFRNFYFQLNNLFAYILLIPTIAAGTITLGIMNQIIRAFSEVTSSFQYLVRSWSTIIDLISVFKRLQAFESAFKGEELSNLDKEYIETDGKVDY